MCVIAAGEGYAAASIARVIAHAGVSRPTFYEYFIDKEDCFVALIAFIHERVLGDVRRAVRRERPERAPHAATAALVEFAAARPAIARLLMGETMRAGHRALDARDQGIAQIARILEDVCEGLDDAVALPELEPRMLIGGIYRLVATKLRDDEKGLSGLTEHLADLIAGYEHPIERHRWRRLEPIGVPAAQPRTPPLLPPTIPPRGRPISERARVENQRLRILFATAEIAAARGSGAATINEITKLARVDHRAFRRLFRDRDAVYEAVYELYFQHLMAATARAYFAADSWPERVWHAAIAGAQTIEQNRTLAQVGFVEAQAAGPAAAKRVDEFLLAFTIFLKEGYQHDPPPARAPSPLALEAIANTSYELVYIATRTSPKAQITGFAPHLAFLALAPFLGAAEANRFIEQKLGDRER
jgi:AcrR family transcriptional regulator